MHACESVEEGAGQALAATAFLNRILRAKHAEAGRAAERAAQLGDEHLGTVVQHRVQAFQHALARQVEFVQQQPGAGFDGLEQRTVRPAARASARAREVGPCVRVLLCMAWGWKGRGAGAVRTCRGSRQAHGDSKPRQPTPGAAPKPVAHVRANPAHQAKVPAASCSTGRSAPSRSIMSVCSLRLTRTSVCPTAAASAATRLVLPTPGLPSSSTALGSCVAGGGGACVHLCPHARPRSQGQRAGPRPGSRQACTNSQAGKGVRQGAVCARQARAQLKKFGQHVAGPYQRACL